MTINRICGSGYQSMVSLWSEIQTVTLKSDWLAERNPFPALIFIFPRGIPLRRFRQQQKTSARPNEEAHFELRPPEAWPSGVDGRHRRPHRRALPHISREDSDRFAYEAQMKNKLANEQGKFVKEIVPVEVVLRKNSFVFDKDEFGKPDTTLRVLPSSSPPLQKTAW
jgi:hypothetical protein